MCSLRFMKETHRLDGGYDSSKCSHSITESLSQKASRLCVIYYTMPPNYRQLHKYLLLKDIHCATHDILLCTNRPRNP